MRRRDELLRTARDRFQQLAEYARDRGLGFVLENEISAALCPSRYSNGEPKMHFMPFTARDAINFIAGESQTLDTAHYGASRGLPAQFTKNGEDTARETIFALFDCSDWTGYNERIGSFDDSLTACSYHVSNTEGIGVHLEAFPELERKWGRDGTEGGTISPQEFQRIFRDAHEKGKPCAIEVNYDIKNIPVHKYKEADIFLRPFLANGSQTN